MNSENKFQTLEHKESNAVVSFSNGTTFKISKLMERINSFFTHLVLKNLSEQLRQAGLGTLPEHSNLTGAVTAEILEPQSGEWKKGRVRVRVILEFCPDELEEEVKDSDLHQNASSLDDIRQTMT